MQIPLQIPDLQSLLQNPGSILVLGILVALFAYTGRRGSRGPATATPLTFLLIIGLLMIGFGLLGLLK